MRAIAMTEVAGLCWKRASSCLIPPGLRIALVPRKKFAKLRAMTRAVSILCRWLMLLACAATASSGKDGKLAFPSKPATNATVVELKGRFVAPAPSSGERLKFQTESGAVYTLVSNRMSSALFIDTNFQTKTLLLKGRVSMPTGRFEVTGNLRSIRDGKIHELYYYCDICAIKGSEPGPCMCCREPVHLVEQSVK